MKTIHKILIALAGLFVLIAAVIGIGLAKNMGQAAKTAASEQRATSKAQTTLAQLQNGFSSAKTDTDKINALKLLELSAGALPTKTSQDKKLAATYQSTINKDKSSILADYDKILSENTLTNLHSITDKSKLNAATTALTALDNRITKETGTVTTSDQLKTYQSKISTLLASYRTQVASLAMDLTQIEKGNFTSLVGTWKNPAGETLNITSSTITTQAFPAIKMQGTTAATLTGLKLSIPSLNTQNGTPQTVPGVRGTSLTAGAPYYQQTLKISPPNPAHYGTNYLALYSSIPDAFVAIEFLPAGKLPFNSPETPANNTSSEDRIAITSGQNANFPITTAFTRINS
ncbi:MAG: DUF6287 domain-containing protein [Streptococcaceae bacterium]|jgi:hypothetical protein|nr:DUF6287 domain-containing protein [Streptococcaceae bacterium]